VKIKMSQAFQQFPGTYSSKDAIIKTNQYQQHKLLMLAFLQSIKDFQHMAIWLKLSNPNYAQSCRESNPVPVDCKFGELNNTIQCNFIDARCRNSLPLKQTETETLVGTGLHLFQPASPSHSYVKPTSNKSLFKRRLKIQI